MSNHFWKRLCDARRFNYLLRNDLLMGPLTLLSLIRHYRPLIVYMRTGDNRDNCSAVHRLLEDKVTTKGLILTRLFRLLGRRRSTASGWETHEDLEVVLLFVSAPKLET